MQQRHVFGNLARSKMASLVRTESLLGDTMKLNILISTIDERICQVPSVLLAPLEGVSYIVAHQYTSEGKPPIPEALCRPDVQVSQIRGKGITFGRNHTLDLADGDIALLADDDVTYRSEYFQSICHVMQSNRTLALAKFKIKTPDDEPEYKDYPDEEYDLLTSEGTSSVEIAIRMSSIVKFGIRFDTRFGVGNSHLIGGEEQIFIHDCLEAGLSARYFPIYVVEHPYMSTVKHIEHYDARRIRVRGGLDARLNGWISIPKAIAGSIRYCPETLRHGSNPIIYLRERLAGAVHVLTTSPPEKAST